MALRSGYYGLKNSVKRSLEKLASDMSGAKIIKTIGDGLSLSDQGALAANIDSETMEFKNHKLAAKITSGFSYDLLWGNETIADQPTAPATVELSNPFTDYDMLLIVCGFISTGVKCFEHWFALTNDMSQLTVDPTADTDKLLVFSVNAGAQSGTGQWVRMGLHGDDNTGLSFRYNNSAGIYKIYGIKF